MDAVQIAFALLDVWEKLSRNLPDLDLKTKTLTLGHSEAARALAKMLDERVGAREQLAAACIADSSLAARLEAVAEAMPFAESLRAAMPSAPAHVAEAPVVDAPTAPVLEVAPEVTPNHVDG
jgi:ATP phosphoribosyltransferase regulatory subunit HisZ